MPYTTFGKNLMLDTLAPTHVSAHTADPTDAGLNEVVGGSYARQSITWNAAATGNLNSSNVPSVPVPAGVTVTHVGYWDALSGGNFLGYSDITDESFANSGTLNLVDADLDLNA